MHSSRFIGMYSQTDVKLIILQILSMQALFYLAYVVLLGVFNAVFGLPMHLGQIFDFSIYSSEIGGGGGGSTLPTATSTLITATDEAIAAAAGSLESSRLAYVSYLTNIFAIPLVIVGLANVVVKANKVLDFVTTVYGYHFLICLVYSGLSNLSLKWITVNAVIIIVTILAGEYACIRLEQMEIKLLDNLFVAFGPTRKTAKKAAAEDDEESTFTSRNSRNSSTINSQGKRNTTKYLQMSDVFEV